MSDWVETAIWWHVYPLGFLGAETTNADRRPPVDRLSRLADWFDYAIELGVSGLLLGPVFDSRTHGYDTIDHYRIDPRLGTESEFVELVEAAHARGLRVLLDGVFGHVGREFAAFRRVLELGPDAPEAHWFRLSWPDGSLPGSEPDYATFEGHHELVGLNHDEPAVAEYVADVMTYWSSRGVDGWRLDAAYAVPNAFWATVLSRVRQEHPDLYVFGEVIHGDYAEIVHEATLDSVTQYELWKAIWSSLVDRNLYELAWALDRHNGWLESFVPFTFVGNHDVTRLASKLTDDRHIALALVVLFTTGGTPAIYYGDEQAFRGIKEERFGGDDAIRPEFPVDGPRGLAAFGWSTYRLHQRLIALRRRNPWLHRARTEMLELTNTQLVYASVDGDQRLVVGLNLDDEPFEYPEAGLTVSSNSWAVAEPEP